MMTIPTKPNINDSSFFERHKTDKYFHACDDHLDVYSRYVELLNSLDFRAYILVLNKKTEYFNELIENKSEKEIYNDLVFKLLYDRLLKRKNSINLLTFERLNNKLNKEKEEKEDVIFNINKALKDKVLIESDLNFSVEIKDKNDSLLSVVDYVIHIIGRLYEGKNGKVENYMKHNFRLIEPKIALILDIASNVYHKPRTEKIDIEKLFIKN